MDLDTAPSTVTGWLKPCLSLSWQRLCPFTFLEALLSHPRTIAPTPSPTLSRGPSPTLSRVPS